MAEDTTMYEIKHLIEFFAEGLPLLSPADFTRLEERLRKEDDLRELFTQYKSLAEACEDGSRFLIAQIEYRAKTRSSVYFHIYGTRGMGKSEVGMSISIIVIQSYRKYASIDPTMTFGRSPSELNMKLANATKKGISLMLISDEAEDESGTGSATEETSLIGNLDTMRVLMHSVGRLSIPYRRGFGLRCDFILEPILQDRANRINYCVVYTPDPDTGTKKATYLIDIPLHENANLREEYEAWKEREQRKFTGAGGRRSRLREKLAPFVDALVQVAKDEGDDITSWSQLEDLLCFDVKNGDSLVSGEVSKVMKRAFRVLKKGKKRKGKISKLQPYRGQITNLRTAIYDRLVERGVPPDEVEMFRRYSKGLESQSDIAFAFGTNQKEVSLKTKAIRKKDMGGAFEDVYAEILRQKFADSELIVEQGGANTPLPDITILNKDLTVNSIYSVKCYWDRKTISLPRSEIAKSELEYVGSEVPVYLIFFDFVDGRLFEPIPITEQLAWTFTKDGNVKETFRVED